MNVHVGVVVDFIARNVRMRGLVFAMWENEKGPRASIAVLGDNSVFIVDPTGCAPVKDATRYLSQDD